MLTGKCEATRLGWSSGTCLCPQILLESPAGSLVGPTRDVYGSRRQIRSRQQAGRKQQREVDKEKQVPRPVPGWPPPLRPTSPH